VDSADYELLEGMGNCYRACGKGFEETVEMVAGARDRTTEDVRRTLADIRQRYRDDADYLRLRRRLPEEFPV
jgi:hypothetical protein